MVSDSGQFQAGGDGSDGDADVSGETIDCQSVSDFYTPAGRDTIGRFCRRILDEQILIPSELLHSARHQQAVSNLATFVSILGQADRALKRKKPIATLVNDAARQTRDRLKPVTLPDLAPATASKALETLLGGDKDTFLAEAAVTQALLPYRTFSDKAILLIELAITVDDAGGRSLIDRFLSEIVRSEAGIASIGASLSYATLIDTLVTLISADGRLPVESTPEIMLKLEQVVGLARMPQLNEGLIVAFQRLMRNPQYLTIASAGDRFGVEAVQRELVELARLASRMRIEDAYRGGQATVAAFERRGARLVNEDTLHEIIRGQSFIQKLRTLFMLQRMPLPLLARQAVHNYLRQFFAAREFAGRLLDCWKDRSDKLRGIAEVQKMVLAGTFPDDEKRELAAQVDDIQCAFIRTFHVLAALSGKGDPPPDQVLEVLKLAAEEAFCKGRARLGVARVLYRQVHRPRFLRLFFQNSGTDRATRVAWLRNALGIVGVPFIDMAALRVLIVDDEAGPRKFVKSALHDMGVDTVEEASDGEEAIHKLEDRLDETDLVVCDWMMPRMAGIDVLRWVRERRPELPFLMVTALATPKAVQKAIENKVSAYIAKPFTPDQFEDKIFMALIAAGPTS